MKNPFSKYIIGILSLLMIFTVTSHVSADETFVNGEYKSFVKALKMESDKDSMVEERLIKPVNLMIQDNRTVVTFKITEPLQLSFIKSDGTVVPTEDLGNNTYKFTVEDIHLDASNPAFIANMQIYIPQAPAIVRNQKFRFVFSDFELIKADEQETPSKDETSQNAKPNIPGDVAKDEGEEVNSAPVTAESKEQTEEKPSNPKTGDTFSMSYIFLAFILLAGVTYSFRLRRQ